jgi:hypothetical protein
MTSSTSPGESPRRYCRSWRSMGTRTSSSRVVREPPTERDDPGLIRTPCRGTNGVTRVTDTAEQRTCGRQHVPEKKFTEPVALSSTPPGDIPLPRTALRLSFDLVALRARCEGQPTAGRHDRQGGRERVCRSLRSSSSARPIDGHATWATGPSGRRMRRAR